MEKDQSDCIQAPNSDKLQSPYVLLIVPWGILYTKYPWIIRANLEKCFPGVQINENR